MSKIAILGSGAVGESLEKGFTSSGHEAKRGGRATFAELAAWGDIVVLAIKGTAAEGVVKELASALAGKIVIDTTNPIDEGKADNGVIRYFTNANESLMERLQAAAPAAKLVKAFNSIGNALYYQPKFAVRGTMFICGHDAAAKAEVGKLLDGFGWDAFDAGGVESARPIEALCQLWCAPGFLRNDWMHGFAFLPLQR